jgi:Protein of unknown function (DUF2958)
MILIPDNFRPQLLANGRDPSADHIPLIKLFNPCGAATWLISEIQPYDEDILFGLCDLGMGFPEIGPVSLSELQSVKGRLGLGIERDLLFVGRYALSVYAEAASQQGGITTILSLLDAAAARLAARRNGGV